MFALKEWQVVIDAILDRKQFILLRKGGILDTPYDFPPDKKMFFLFPTYEHQNKKFVREEFHYIFKQPEDKYKIKVLCNLIKCISIRSMELLKLLLPYVIYTEEFLLMRFKYRPNEPLNVLFISPEKLEYDITVEYDNYDRGCKSWIQLTNKNIGEKSFSQKEEQIHLSSGAVFEQKHYDMIDKIISELEYRQTRK